MLLTWLIAVPMIFAIGYFIRLKMGCETSWGSNRSYSITKNEWIFGSALAIVIGVPFSSIGMVRNVDQIRRILY